MKKLAIKDFIHGTIDTLEDRSLPDGAASAALNWVTEGDHVELRRGYNILGNTLTGSGKITGLIVAKKRDGSELIYRTRGKKLEYYNADTDEWEEVGTDILGDDADGKEISFAEYHPIAGDQLFINSPYGPFLKIMMANPTDYADMYDASKNYKGYIQIKQHRMFLWGRLKDKTGLYLSYIDKQEFSDYTSVSGEVIGTGDGSTKTFSNTLAFKAAGAKRTCFGIEVTDGVETFTDNKDGTLTGNKGGTGTINYMTGEISVTFNTAPNNGQDITCDYQWEDSTDGGVCDFTHSSPRQAGEGVSFRQDEGGDIMSVASYGQDEYCFHEKKSWVLRLTTDDTNATNLIYREKSGIPNWRAAVPTAEGIYYIDNSSDKDPQMKSLMLQPLSGNVLPVPISRAKKYRNTLQGKDLSDYEFDQAAGIEWGDKILFACRTKDSDVNNRVIVYDKKKRTIDVMDYYVSCFAIYGGTLIAGDPLTNNVYTLFSGFDDDDSLINNYWEGNNSNLGFMGLKKVKKLVIQGKIAKEQTIKVSASIDQGAWVEVGEIEGNGSYVDIGQAITVGSLTIGSREIGGGGTGVNAYNYKREMPLPFGKFNRIKLKFEATGIGYADISMIQFYDIRIKSEKIASKYRS